LKTFRNCLPLDTPPQDTVKSLLLLLLLLFSMKMMMMMMILMALV